MVRPDAVENYFLRFGLHGPLIATPPASDLRCVIVIPCFNEPDLQCALDSLWNCDRPTSPVELIVVINSAADASPSIRENNEGTFRKALAWSDRHRDQGFACYPLCLPDLPPRHAGVGFARKIGMDEAVRRLRGQGIIVCFDADSQCDRNYLCAIEKHFAQEIDSPGASIYFEHPLKGLLPERVYDAAAIYELHLRYYVQALRYAGFPYAFHTIGSAMAVRADTYMEQGGMNKRKAGEDFYFLQKVIALGGFTEVKATRVIPSPRESDRVPFGTGKAVSDQLRGQVRETYPLEAFLDLKSFWEALPDWSGASSGIREFLSTQNIDQVVAEIRANTSGKETFIRRFVRWFDGFRAMKFVHFARDYHYGARPITAEARRLLCLLNPNRAWPADARSLLAIFRHLDRSGRLPNAETPSMNRGRN